MKTATKIFRRLLSYLQICTLITTTVLPLGLQNTYATTITVPENTSTGTSVHTFPDLGLSTPFSFAAGTGGEDNGKFTIDSNGTLILNFSPDHSNPTDANSDNIYNVKVKKIETVDFAETTYSETLNKHSYNHTNGKGHNYYGGFYNASNYPNYRGFAGLNQDGKIVSWGNAGFDQSPAPTAPTGTGFTHIFSYGGGFAALTPTGEIKVWGIPSWGPGDYTDPPTGTGFTDIVSNWAAAATLDPNDGSVKVWGHTYFGGAASPSELSGGRRYTSAPTDTGYVKLYSAGHGFAALKADGSISSWGINRWGRNTVAKPTDNNYQVIYSTERAFAAIKSDGTLSTWGDGRYGGSGSVGGNGAPSTVTIGTKIYGTAHAFAVLTPTGEIKSWGGQAHYNTPLSTPPSGSGFTEIYPNYDSFAALTPTGEIKVWGNPLHGGDQSQVPVGSGFTEVNAGYFAFAALTPTGEIKVWGDPLKGGNQSQVPTGGGFTKIYSNAHAFAALKNDGSIVSWGNSTYGGTGAPTGTGFTEIYSNEFAFVAVRADGTKACWGEPNWGGTCPTGELFETAKINIIGTYTLTYDSNTGTGTMPNETHTGGTNITLTTNTFTKTGYTFNGWNTQSDGTGTGYSDGGVFTIPNTNTTLYAQWTAKPIEAVDDTLTFIQGNTGSIDVRLNDQVGGSQAHSGNTEVSLSGVLAITGATLDITTGVYTVPDTTPAGTYIQSYKLCEKGSWHFNTVTEQWVWLSGECDTANIAITISPMPITICDDPTATNYSSATGSHVTIDDSTCSYILTYNSNGGNGTMPNETHTGGNTFNLTSNTFTQTGYTFNGWNTASDAIGSRYSDGGTFTMPNTNTTLYAQWAAGTDTPYKIEYYLQNNDATSYPASPNQVENNTGTTHTVVDAGTRTFTGYTYDSSNTNNIQTGTILANGSLVLKRYYTINTYTLTFESNGGTVVASQTGIIYNTHATEPTAPTKTGYTFGGWHTDNTTFNNQFDFAGTPIIEDMTVYAKWIPTTDTIYKIEHYKQNTDSSYPSVSNFTQTLTGTTGESVDAGTKAFTGYSYDASHIGNVQTGSIAGDGSLVLKRYYSIDMYRLDFESNGGTVVASQTGIIHNTTATEPVPPTRANYIFNGWYRDDGTFNDRFHFSIPIVGDTTLYAQWVVPNISALPDNVSFINTDTGSIQVLINDIYNSNIPTVSTVDVTLTGASTIPGVHIDSNGTMIVPPTTMTGTFVVTYQICDKHHPDNCSSAPVSIELVDPIFICTDRNATNYDNRTLGGRIRENNTVCRYSTPPSVPSTPGNGGGGVGPQPVTPKDDPIIPLPDTPSVPSTPSVPDLPSAPDIPSSNATLFPGFVPVCTSAVKNIDDPRLVKYYDVLGVIDAQDPNRRLSRVEFLKLVINASKVDLSKAPKENPFKDTVSHMWYMPYVTYAQFIGLVSGDSNDDFRPNDIITRDEASKIFVKALGVEPAKVVEKGGTSFIDVSTHNTLANYVEAAYESCLVHGRNTLNGMTTDGSPRRFEPKDSISLGETAKVLYNSIGWKNMETGAKEVEVIKKKEVRKKTTQQ